MTAKVRAIASGILGIVLGGLFAALIVLALSITFFGFKLVRVQSSSMEPALSVGDLVLVRPVAPKDIKEGDIILFETNVGAQVMHRVVGINSIITNVRTPEGELLESNEKFRFLTQGDANPNPDAGDVPQEQVIGEYWFSIPLLGGADALPLQMMLMLLAGFIALGWISWEGFQWTSRRRKTPPTTGPEHAQMELDS